MTDHDVWLMANARRGLGQSWLVTLFDPDGSEVAQTAAANLGQVRNWAAKHGVPKDLWTRKGGHKGGYHVAEAVIHDE